MARELTLDRPALAAKCGLSIIELAAALAELERRGFIRGISERVGDQFTGVRLLYPVQDFEQRRP